MHFARDPEQLTLDEAAEMLGMSTHTLERWARTGRIPSSLGDDGVRTFKRSELVSRSVSIDDLHQQD